MLSKTSLFFGQKRVGGISGGRRWMGRNVAFPSPKKRRQLRERPPEIINSPLPFSTQLGSTTSQSLCHDEIFNKLERFSDVSENILMQQLDCTPQFAETVGVWFSQNDLRLHDHYPFTLALEEADTRTRQQLFGTDCPVVALFVFDIRLFAQPSLLSGFFRASPIRARFLMNTISALREKLRKNGTELFVRVGLPEIEVPKFCSDLNCSKLFASTQYAPHEKYVQDSVREKLFQLSSSSSSEKNNNENNNESENNNNSSSSSILNCKLQTVWNSTLVHIDDLTTHPLSKSSSSSSSSSSENNNNNFDFENYKFPDRFRQFWDEVETARIRPTAPYDCSEFGSNKKSKKTVVPQLFSPTILATDNISDDRNVFSSFSSVAHTEIEILNLENSASSSSENKIKKIVRVGKFGEKQGVVFSSNSSSTKLLLEMNNINNNQQQKQKQNNIENENSSGVKIISSGAIPTLDDLGYNVFAGGGGNKSYENNNENNNHSMLTQSEDQGDNYFGAGEDFVLESQIPKWLNERKGLREYAALGRYRNTRVPQEGKTAGKLSVWLSHGSLSPRKLYEVAREFSYSKMGQMTTETAVRELHQRLARRDFWHFLGVKYGRLFFFPWGPRPEMSEDVADPRYDNKIVQRWSHGLTGIPFVDASMRELLETGWCNVTSRKSLMWTLTRGFCQDYRVGAEWFERNSLDYDPFVCYGESMYQAGIFRDRFGDKVWDAKYLANKNDGHGLYTKRWLPQLCRVPEVYLHRVHVMTPKMQKLHGVLLGKNYPYPVKLWDGALENEALPLPAYFVGQKDSSVSSSSSDSKTDDEKIADETNNNAEKVSSSSAEQQQQLEEQQEPEISEVHLEAIKIMNVKTKLGWSESRKEKNLVSNPLNKEEVFPYLSKSSVKAGDQIEFHQRGADYYLEDDLQHQREQEEEQLVPVLASSSSTSELKQQKL